VPVMSPRKGKNLIDSGEELSYVAVDLLKILKKRHDYRRLSIMTGVPVATLTRYLTGKTIPKKNRVKKLIRNILSNINIPSLIAQHMKNGEIYELSSVMFDPNMVKVIGAYVINEYAGTKVTSFLALDTLSIPLTTYLAISTSRPFHVISEEPLTTNGSAVPIVYTEPRSVGAKSLWLTFNRSRKRESLLLVASRTPESSFFNNLVKNLNRMKVEISGFFSIIGDEEELMKLRLPPGCKRSHIIIE